MLKLQTIRATLFCAILVVGLIICAEPAGSEMDCAAIPRWSKTDPPVNQVHVFCGEWHKRKNRPAGLHARPAGNTPATVGTLKITQKPDAKGLYGVRWSYAGHPGRQKFSSMFPDTCSRSQVLKSIVYAANHPKPCPAGAPRWAQCGPNRPAWGSQGYCEASDNSIFTIAFAKLKNSNKVNTAFPLVD